MVELKGSLGGIGLPALVQLIGEQRHSGTLELGRDGTRGRLAFEGGHLVAAEFAGEHGLPALASCARDLKDADFTFVEGAPSPEQTLNFGPPELQSLLNRVLNGDFAVAEQVANHVAEVELAQACPLLGFADDPERHYGRPTALHRCYASGAPSLVTSVEQRNLCLSGRYAACPRYRNWEIPPLPDRASDATVPPSVASRLVAASPMRVEPTPAEREVEPKPEAEVPAAVATEPPAAPSETPKRRWPLLPARIPDASGLRARIPDLSGLRARMPDLSGLQFLAIGVVLGVVLVFLVFAVALPALNSSTAQKPSPVAGPALQPVAPTVALLPTPLPRPTSVPTVAPTATAPPRPSTPTTIPQPRVGPVSTRSLVDFRFAQGPAQGWLDNPPFAEWSDGAYRLQATQAARFVALGVPIDARLTDVLVTATFRKTGGPPGGGYGLIVRDQGPQPRDGESQEGQYYVLETGDLGEYGIWRRDGDHWIDLVPWMRSPSVRPGGSPNDLAVRAVGNQLSFVVNGAQLASITDNTLLSGGVGIFVGGDYNQVALDRFSVALPD